VGQLELINRVIFTVELMLMIYKFYTYFFHHHQFSTKSARRSCCTSSRKRWASRTPTCTSPRWCCTSCFCRSWWWLGRRVQWPTFRMDVCCIAKRGKPSKVSRKWRNCPIRRRKRTRKLVRHGRSILATPMGWGCYRFRLGFCSPFSIHR